MKNLTDNGSVCLGTEVLESPNHCHWLVHSSIWVLLITSEISDAQNIVVKKCVRICLKLLIWYLVIQMHQYCLKVAVSTYVLKISTFYIQRTWHNFLNIWLMYSGFVWQTKIIRNLKLVGKILWYILHIYTHTCI